MPGDAVLAGSAVVRMRGGTGETAAARAQNRVQRRTCSIIAVTCTPDRATTVHPGPPA